MMTILYIFFMTPFIFKDLVLFQFLFILILLVFLKSNFYNFFCNINYNFGIDMFYFFLIILVFLIICFMIMSVNLIFMMSFFIFMIIMICLILFFIFVCMNLFMFYLFFEFSLIPLMIMIFGWGYQPERLISGFYLFFYTLMASLPLLILIIYIYYLNNSLFIGFFYFINLNLIIYFFMIISFMVKFPMFMVHFWLPKAHVQAPIFGSMILAGLMLKVGGYGFIRLMYMFDYMFMHYSYFLYSLGLIGCLIVSLICLIQGDMKCLIAYSSISHMSLCLLGLLSLTKVGLLGSYLMMISHGFSSSGLFCLSNLIYNCSLSRSFYINKGMVMYMPGVSLLVFIFCLFNMSCPPSINFLSELFIMYGMINYWSFSFFFFIIISFLSACFSFFMFSYSQYGQSSNFFSFMTVKISDYFLVFIHLIMVLGFVFICPLMFY
uniref:NADH dehydrogenase subunit 4 n=1 Tax=Krisna nigromarginata TaxID=1962557 RepID=UPI002551D7F3|nr:NADH dehydrogenase subunit 4 [Krisna nigromarginata]WGG89441.1 NADH dehydrogenase subunit 4 [Krisna nigromarginata]